MMRLLVALAAVQILAIGLLTVEMTGLQDEVQRLSSRAAAAPPQPRQSSDVGSTNELQGTPTFLMTSDETLEAIRFTVREELESALAALQRPGNEGLAATRTMNEEESLDRLLATRDTIDLYVQQGQISPQNMTSLQRQIAKLNPGDRSKALSYLVGAMNNGQMDARM
ncbi:MAG: hypothetical protein ABJ308_07325 [Halieaceae bacterium]